MWIYILLVLAILIVCAVLIIYHDTHSFVVRTYDLYTDKLKKNDTYSFVLLSDLHGYTFGRNNEKLIQAIDEISPDAVLCAGDMFTGHKIKGEVRYQAGLNVLTNLAERYPVYIGNGNHEHKIKSYTMEFGNLYDRYRTALKKSGVTVLENDSVTLADNNIRITGLDLDLSYFKKVIKKPMESGHIERTVGHRSKSDYQVLIAHNPQYFENYVEWGADLTVSGHVHGGIIRLPLIGGVVSPSIALFPKYDGGKYEKDGKTMILSRGLGTHTIHVRMFNPCELDVIRLHKA